MKNTRQSYWLMKSEPEVYSLSQLQKDGKTLWSGVRNYQARNFMMNDMNIGDQILFYHSNAEPPGIAGLAQVSGPAVEDATAQDKKSDAYDPKANKEKPIWFCVEVEFVKHFSQLVSLAQLKNEASLKDLLVVQRGQRLSVQPVSEKHFHFILKMGS
jgi:predicted RNA-binding protein with PUA-like domain